MVVQHNLRAMNSNRMLGLTARTQSKSTEKLSSGYKINRAADDAAGLSISEKMRKQIRGLSQASLNASDGISAVQTAEGALNEVQDMLQRMNELAVKAANGTMSEDDRSYIQNEISQLETEIDRVAETTKFNESYLLKGTDEAVTKTLNAHDAGIAGKLTANGDGTSTFALEKALEDGDKITIAGEEYTIGSTTANTDGYKKIDDLKTETFNVGDSVKATDGKTYALVDKATVSDYALVNGDTVDIDGVTYTIAGATSLAANELSATDANLKITEALQTGKEAYLTKVTNAIGVYAGGASVKVQYVTALDTADDNKEISSLKLNANTSLTVEDFLVDTNAVSQTNGLEAGNVVTLKGTSIEATANEPATMDAVKEVIKQLKYDKDTPTNSDELTIGAIPYEIAEETDLANNKLSVDDALALIKDKNTVQFSNITSAEGESALKLAGLLEGTNYTVIESKAVSNEGNVISKTDAYKMIADELAKASSIGADEAATVTSNNSGSFTITQGTTEVKGALTFGLHVGADADMTNKISISIDSMNAAGLGIKDLKVDGKDSTNATYAVDAILDAIQKVSTQRSALGAVQNRLEHTIANLDSVVENTTAAESQIRDTDMATEMVKYSNNNILAQAGQAMLAQANQSNQGVLSLLG